MHRRDQIQLVLRQLEHCRVSAAAAGQTYALEETICLMKALRSVAGYINWLTRRLPKLRPDGLLERFYCALPHRWPAKSAPGHAEHPQKRLLSQFVWVVAGS